MIDFKYKESVSFFMLKIDCVLFESFRINDWFELFWAAIENKKMPPKKL